MADRTSAQIARFRERLAVELAEQRALSASTAQARAPVELDQQSVGRLSRIDAMQMQAMSAAAEGRRRSRIARIEQALRRCDDGSFGVCLECGEDIALPRLDLDPVIHLCIRCAR